jgi:hypothetical protein
VSGPRDRGTHHSKKSGNCAPLVRGQCRARTSRASLSEVRVHRGQSGRVFGAVDVSAADGLFRFADLRLSGFYAWLKEPLSQRAFEGARQTELIQKAWADSSKVYGFRKLTDNRCNAGETHSENRVARLASLARIAAQIGYKRCPGRYNGKPAVGADNSLDRQFEVPSHACKHALPGSGHHIYQNPRRMVLSVCRH